MAVRVKYINNNPVQGIKYDWKKILKEYEKLKVPIEYDYSKIIPWQNDAIKWHVMCSERSVGKTTVLLLMGMIMNKLYGTVIQLVRHHIDNASYYSNLFKTVNEYEGGRYINQLTDGKYNSVYYYSKNFYYCRVENGKRVETCEEPLCVALDASDCYSLCSKYEAPRGDLIILDECFNDKNRPEEFQRFIHLHKTIVRERMSDKIFIVGNNLDVNNIWYRQLTIQRQVRTLKKGQNIVAYTNMGMPISVHFLENRSPQMREAFNKAHYGFDDPQLNAITGNGEWNLKQYPQIHDLYNRKRLGRGVYFNYHDELFLEGEFIECDSGLFFAVHPAQWNAAQRAELVFTLHFPQKANQVYFGNDKISTMIKHFIMKKQIVFSDNETGDLFEKFLSESA